MPEYWKNRYEELTRFILQHPEVHIREKLVQIPKDMRSEFYRLFDSVRITYLREIFPNFIRDSAMLVKEYIQVEQEVINLLELKSISAPYTVSAFLHNPAEELVRGLFHILFDLLQAKIDLQIFENKASQEIKSSYNKLSQSGYEKWITLSLIKLLQADKLFQVNLRPFSSSELWKKGRRSREEVPVPKVSKRLVFNSYSLDNTFTIPDVIIHSAAMNKYIALGLEIGGSSAVASNASEKRDWYPVDSTSLTGIGLTLVYLADKPEDISLIADAERVCRPDLIIGCTVKEGSYLKEGFEKINYYHSRLNPRLGTYMVSRDPMLNRSLREDIHVLNVGFKQQNLEYIINVLSRQMEQVLI